jgi:hypothetical protein|tara:strand:- start:83 stop:1012 length:930 start_codon:yes stop_codon:yes gene_type:complete
MKVVVFHQPFPMGNHRVNIAISKELTDMGHEVYSLEQLNGRYLDDEYRQQLKDLDPDVLYFEMLDAETFELVEEFDCKKVLTFVSPGILGEYNKIFDYQDKWFTHIYTNSLQLYNEFQSKNIPSQHFEWFFSQIGENDVEFVDEYNHGCVFLGMGFNRLTSEAYDLERKLFFSGGFAGIDFKIYGNGWPNWPEYKGILPSEDIGKLYTSARSGIAIIAPAQRNMGMINNRYSEMGYCELPITTYKYDLDWFGAEKYLNFIENKEEAYTTIKDIIGNPSKYKSKSVELKKFVQNKTNEFFEKLEELIVEE